MTKREEARNHLRLADDTCEAFKSTTPRTSYKERAAMSFVLLCVRALVAGLQDIADAVRERS